MRSNCLLYAVRQWITHGGYLLLRKSRYGWWPHALWSRDLTVLSEFVPLAPRRRWLPPLWFKGMVRVRLMVEAGEPPTR
jgi:hypothetical protein